MSRWNRIALDRIAESVDYGVTASATEIPAGPKFLRITDIQDNKVNWNTVPWCECDERAGKASRLRPGDIVFARTGATTGKSFLIKECPPDAVFASYLIRVRVRNDVEPRYISHFFQTSDYWSQISKGARGAAQPGVNATTLKALEVPLPPLPEQRRIVTILDQAETLRGRRREALKELDSLTQSIFIEMFGDPIQNPKGWKVAPLSSCAERIQIGPFGTQLHEEDYIEGGIPLVNPTHIHMGKIRPDRSLTVSEVKYKQLSQYHLDVGDLILGRRGEMGRCAVVGSLERGWLCGTGSLFVRPRTDAMTSTYLSHIISSPSMRRYLENVAQGVTMANLNKVIVGALPIPVPPLERQHQFNCQLNALETLKNSQRRSLDELGSLFASLQHRAFRGEL